MSGLKIIQCPFKAGISLKIVFVDGNNLLSKFAPRLFDALPGVPKTEEELGEYFASRLWKAEDDVFAFTDDEHVKACRFSAEDETQNKAKLDLLVDSFLSARAESMRDGKEVGVQQVRLDAFFDEEHERHVFRLMPSSGVQPPPKISVVFRDRLPELPGVPKTEEALGAFFSSHLQPDASKPFLFGCGEHIKYCGFSNHSQEHNDAKMHALVEGFALEHQADGPLHNSVVSPRVGLNVSFDAVDKLHRFIMIPLPIECV